MTPLPYPLGPSCHPVSRQRRKNSNIPTSDQWFQLAIIIYAVHHQNVQSIAIKIFHAEFPWIPKKIHCFRRLSLWVKNSEAYSEVRSNCLIGQKIFLYVVFSIHIWSWITHFQKTLPYLTWCWDNVFVSTIIMIIKEDNCLRQITVSIEI